MLFKALNILLLVSSIQGVLFAFFAFTFKKFKGKSTIFLGLLIMGMALNNLQYLLWETDLVNKETFYGIYFIPYESVIPAFLYFYIKYFLFPGDVPAFFEKLLFGPFILFSLIFFVYKIYYFYGATGWINETLLDGAIIINSISSISFTFIISIICFRIAWRFRNLQINNKSRVPNIWINWLLTFVAIFFLLCFFWLYGLLNELKLGTENTQSYYILWMIMSISIYVFGHIGLYNFGLNRKLATLHEYISKSPKLNLLSSEGNPYILAFEQWILEDKKYLDSELSLEKTAYELGLSKGHFSRILHAELNIGFNDYINKLRINEAVLYLKSNEFDNYTIEALGLQSGFNSKSSFYSAFKKYVGLTPSELKKVL